MGRIGDKGPAEAQGKWLLTFNDMMTLLFAFFVLIISMSSLDTVQVRGLAVTVRKMLGHPAPPPGAKMVVVGSVIPSLRDADIERERLKARSREIESGPAGRKKALYHYFLQWEGVLALPRKDCLALLLSEPLLFAPGSADVSGKGLQLLKSMAAVMPNRDVEIGVEGHTDDLPLREGRYPSNWELSMARAVNVVKYLIDEGKVAPEILSAVGYGDAKPRWPNFPASNRQLNRRVEVVIKFKEDAR